MSCCPQLARRFGQLWQQLRGGSSAAPRRSGPAVEKPIDPFLESAFSMAAEESRLIVPEPSVTTKLVLYALYKQAMAGNAPMAPTSALGLTSATKWRAWDRVRGTSRARAMHQYIEVVKCCQRAAGDAGRTDGDGLLRDQDEDEDDRDNDDDDDDDLAASLVSGMAGPVMSSLAGEHSDADDNDARALPLHAAARRGDMAQCRALVREGAAVDATDDEQHSALHWACDQGHADVVSRRKANKDLTWTQSLKN